MDISFLSINKEDKDFEICVELLANKIWSQDEVFGNEYGEDECPGDILVIGGFYDNLDCTLFEKDSRYSSFRAVCTTIIEISASGKKALISCMGVYPQKHGYGTSLIQYIIKLLKNLGVTEICLKIDKDDKAERLEKFYINNGFTKVKEYKEYEKDVLFYYDSKYEYIMSCKLDLDLDITNLKIDS
jgi:hypothetical protein